MSAAGYSGTPLVRKLGINPGMTVALLRAPADFRRELVGLPDDVDIRTRVSAPVALVIWFVGSRVELEHGVGRHGDLMTAGLWIAWPKKSSGVVTDLTEDVVRRAGLAHGLVDYKVCAINEVWSGLKFARRKRPKTTPGVVLRKA